MHCFSLVILSPLSRFAPSTAWQFAHIDLFVNVPLNQSINGVIFLTTKPNANVFIGNI